jgi:quinol monooxygenase YgiN
MEETVSVLCVVKVPGDVAKAKAAFVEHADEMREISSRGKAAGAIHHRFGVGDGFILVVDEWDTAEHFETFFSNPDLHAFMATMGATGAPEITIVEGVTTADQF